MNHGSSVTRPTVVVRRSSAVTWVSSDAVRRNLGQTGRVAPSVSPVAPHPGARDDRSWGAFSETPPWVLDRRELAWSNVAAVLRAAAHAEVPQLTQARKVPPGARVVTVVGRLAGAIVPWFVTRRRGAFADPSASRGDVSRRLRRAVETLGPTYIKLGQIISSGEGLFPAELVNEFRLCRDQVPAEPFDSVRRTVETDLGARLGDVFAEFSPTPLAAASIAQVHLARLVTGEEVVVKVQRPQVADLVRRDLRVMSWLAPALVGRIPIAALANPPALVELFAETIVEELDFRIEAANMLDMAQVLHDLGQTSFIVPRPHPRLVTRRVLVMERLHGFSLDDVEGMQAAGIDTHEVVRSQMIALMEGAMVHGLFHGDLHGGNLFVMPDGRTALLDFGIVGRLSQARRMAFLRIGLDAAHRTLDRVTRQLLIRGVVVLPQLCAGQTGGLLGGPRRSGAPLPGRQLIGARPRGGRRGRGGCCCRCRVHVVSMLRAHADTRPVRALVGAVERWWSGAPGGACVAWGARPGMSGAQSSSLLDWRSDASNNGHAWDASAQWPQGAGTRPAPRK